MLRRIAALAVAGTIVAAPLPAQESGGDFFAQAERFLRRIAAQYAIVVLRSVVDVTYESMVIDPRGNDLVLTGLRIRPELDWDREGACVLSVDRLRSGDLNTLTRFRSVLTVNGLSVPPACFPPPAAATLAGFGLEPLAIDSMTVDASYDFPSSGAELALQAAVRDAGDLTLTADFDYLFLRFGGLEAVGTGDAEMPESAEPIPVAWLSRLEIAFENEGLFERVEPMFAGQFGGAEALPRIVRGGLIEALSEGGTRQLGAFEQQFVENVASEVARFVRDRDRIVLTVAPERPVLLTEEMFESPVSALAALHPSLAAVTKARRDLIPPAAVGAALTQGADLPDEERLRIGRALATGEGAPRAPRAAAELLRPLAEGWNAEANLLIARTLATEGRSEEAYAHALRALAAGARDAIGLADELETALALDRVLALQGRVREALPPGLRPEEPSLLAEGDVAALRARAYALSVGDDAPRSYADAYYWAALAAAAGEQASDALMERLDARFRGLAPEERSAWADAAARASERALETWTEGGVGARLAGE